MLPATETTLALARGAGSLGPSVQLSKFPVATVRATETVSDAVLPSLPPMNRISEPIRMAAPSVRPCGRASCVGDGCHGMTAPPGAGHGRGSFEGGQRLIGDQTRTPRATVRPTGRE